MKILYAIQATGNGHLSRAREIIPELVKHGSVDLLVSGTQADVQLPYVIKYKKRGLSYTFGLNGKINLLDSVKNLRPFTLFKDVLSFPVNQYDLVINDFEPVTAWACKLKNKPCVALSHQAAFKSKLTPRPNKVNHGAEWVLKHYAPATTYFGFHFKNFDKQIYTPVIRSEVRQLDAQIKNHITVYLPAHSHGFLVQYFNKFKMVNWQVFSKQAKAIEVFDNVKVFPIQNETFLHSLSLCQGLITAGGFESVAEALYLHKKVLVIPMSNQYEQLCNAQAAMQLGVTVLPELNNEADLVVQHWLNTQQGVRVHYPDLTGQIIEQIIHGASTMVAER